jgi:DNA-directed RNA polymerase specialized sigma24 family protein
MSTPTPIDARLREAARGGDPDAFEQLVAPHRADLHRFCTLMLGCPMQGANLMVTTIEQAESELATSAVGDLDTCSSTRVWLHRIAIRACLRRVGEADR